MQLEYASVVVEARSGRGEDRVRIAALSDGGLVVAVADGAGGTTRGAEAAQWIVDAATDAALADPTCDLVSLLCELDRELRGQSTAIAIVVGRDGGVRGASVGDSVAWLDAHELTEHQHRKPLVGGGCTPVAFAAPPGAVLCVASDGYAKYGPRPDLGAIATTTRSLDDCARTLVDRVRLPTGALADDVAIVLVRRAASRARAECGDGGSGAGQP